MIHFLLSDSKYNLTFQIQDILTKTSPCQLDYMMNKIFCPPPYILLELEIDKGQPQVDVDLSYLHSFSIG